MAEESKKENPNVDSLINFIADVSYDDHFLVMNGLDNFTCMRQQISADEMFLGKKYPRRMVE